MATGDTEVWISIHAAREGGDCPPSKVYAASPPFQSTPPVKAATGIAVATYSNDGISIHAAREGGDHHRENALADRKISIHAAREGGD